MSRLNHMQVEGSSYSPNLIKTPPNAPLILDEMRQEASFISNPPSSLRNSSKLDNIVVYETPTKQPLKNILPKVKFENSAASTSTKLREVSYKNYVGQIQTEKRQKRTRPILMSSYGHSQYLMNGGGASSYIIQRETPEKIQQQFPFINESGNQLNSSILQKK